MVGNVIEAAASSSSGGFNPSTLILILVVVVGFYLLMIRPQRRRQQQAQQQRNTALPGARVRTTAGMYATVVDVDGDDVVLEVAPGVEVRYMRRAIMDVVNPADEPAADSYEVAEEDESDTAEEPVDAAAEADGEAPAAEETAQAPAETGSMKKD